jgi:hypothetical protein
MGAAQSSGHRQAFEHGPDGYLRDRAALRTRKEGKPVMKKPEKLPRALQRVAPALWKDSEDSKTRQSRR